MITCKFCKYGVKYANMPEESEWRGTCRFNPPTLVATPMSDGGANVFTFFPEVKGTDGCGQGERL